MRTSFRKIERIAGQFDVRVSRQKEQARTVLGLHGFLTNIKALENEIDGYWIEQRDTGHYLYRDDLLWA